jgi:hypothetical protein
LVLSLDFQTGYRFEEHLSSNDDRGRLSGADASGPLLKPPLDITNWRRGLALGLTIPNETQLNKNPPPPKSLPGPQVARLTSGRSLIIIARDLVVRKGQNVTTDVLRIPDGFMAMTVFHELSAHASFFQQGQNAAHGQPDVDRNARQAEASYRGVWANAQAAFETRVQQYVTAIENASP